MRFPKTTAFCLSFIFVLAMAAAPVSAQQGQQPPAPVVTVAAGSARVQPQSVFVGTVFFPEVSDVAAEISGRAVRVDFESGQRVRAGQVLASMDTALKQKAIQSRRAELEKVQTSLELAVIDRKRIKALFDTGSVSEQEYDNARFAAKELEKQVQALDRDVDRLGIEMEKAVIRAPFAGVVLERGVDRGEWLSPGARVATLARDDVMDVYVDVPREVFAHAAAGLKVEVTAGGATGQGVVMAAIPSGDQATRTFPVKIRLKGRQGLAQGMEAQVRLPRAGAVEALTVPRDCLVLYQGQNMVYLAVDGKAQPLPVEVVAYEGSQAAVRAQGLSKGAPVIVKGQERLRPGQDIQIIGK